MEISLSARIEEDGRVGLSWRASCSLKSVAFLIIRTGPVPAYTALRLGGEVSQYQIQNLSRHQRYRIAALGAGESGVAVSNWIDVTPRAGLEAVTSGDGPGGLSALVGRIGRVRVMPQDRRLTVYWTLERGFVDKVVVEVLKDSRVWHRMELEPEVSSISLDRARGVPLANDTAYGVRAGVCFAGTTYSMSAEVACTPAAQGALREANRAHPQENLLYPTLAISPEVRVFADDGEEGGQERGAAEVVCCHCRQVVRWNEFRLRCERCNAEFIPNGRGDFLDASRLRFGTCKCCLPKKILVQRAGSESLVCAHSGKEHIRLHGSGENGRQRAFQLIEDLAYGLCQCCRPRRPLSQESRGVVCSKTRELHRNEGGRYVLVPTAPVFDAKAIDDLLDAGLAEICSTGVTKASAKAKRR